MNKIIILLAAIVIALIFIFYNKNISRQKESASTADPDKAYFFVWKETGSEIMDIPDIKGKAIGSLAYGEKISVDFGKFGDIDDDSYQELFLPGGIPEADYFEPDDPIILNTGPPEKNNIYIKGGWLKINHKGKEGFVFTGYLSRLPPPAVTGTSNFPDKQYTILRSDTTKSDIELREEIITIWKEGIIKTEISTEKGSEGSCCLSGITLNEGLLFAWKLLGIEKPELNINPNDLLPGDHYYGIFCRDNEIQLNFPAPVGSISIKMEGNFVIISWGGSC